MVDYFEEQSSEKCWASIDLKFFFSILLFMRPDLKQSEIARQLGIAPPTLSRIINGTYGDGKMRAEWVPVLNHYLQDLDIEKFDQNWKQIKCLAVQYRRKRRHYAIQTALHKEAWFSLWNYNNNWVQPDSRLYYGVDSKSLMMLDIEDNPSDSLTREVMEWRITDKLGRNLRLINGNDQMFFALVTCSQVVFNVCVDILSDIYHPSPYIQSRLPKGNYDNVSVIWIDLEKEKVSMTYNADILNYT